MSIDTNAKYKPPKEYEPKNKDFVPKTKTSSKIIILIAGIVVVAAIIAAVIAATIGIINLVKHIQESNKKDDNQNTALVVNY